MSVAISASLYGIGDSITAGTGASVAGNRYTNLVATSTGFTLVNEGVGSTEILEHSTKAFGHKTSSSPTKTKDQFIFLSGYNDMRHYGTNAAHLQYFTDNLYANTVWCAIQDKYKIYGQDSRGLVTYSGTWTDETSFAGIGKTSSTLNDTATFRVYGTVAYICGLAVQGGSGKFSLSVDGISQGEYNCYNSDDSSLAVVHNHPFLVRISGLAKGYHTVVLTVTVNGGATAFYYATGNGGINRGDEINSAVSPNVYIGNLFYMTSVAYSMYSPMNQGSDNAVNLYNTQIATTCTNLATDGLNVDLVDVISYFVTNTDNFNADLVHPNNAGHQLIANAFIDKIQKNVKRIIISKILQ